MSEKHIAFLCLSILCFILVVYSESEHFGSKNEKLNAIFDYFKTNDRPTYSSYRNAMEGKSNIVDYEIASSLSNKPDFFKEMQTKL
jgi:hypothetical protein